MGSEVLEVRMDSEAEFSTCAGTTLRNFVMGNSQKAFPYKTLIRDFANQQSLLPSEAGSYPCGKRGEVCGHTVVFDDTGLWSVRILRHLRVDSNSLEPALTGYGLDEHFSRLILGESLFGGRT